MAKVLIVAEHLGGKLNAATAKCVSAAQALSPEARQGYAVFTGKGRCATCHYGANLADDGFSKRKLRSADSRTSSTAETRTSATYAFRAARSSRSREPTGPQVHANAAVLEANKAPASQMRASRRITSSSGYTGR